MNLWCCAAFLAHFVLAKCLIGRRRPADICSPPVSQAAGSPATPRLSGCAA